MPEELPDALHLRLPTVLEYVRPARKMVEALLVAQSWPEEAVEEAALIATELVQNAIEHGSKADGTEVAEVTIHMGSEAFVLEVVDPGTGCDPQLLLDRDVTKPVPLDSPRGRGLFLINRIATRLERMRDADGGCRVRARLECQPTS